jgi:hypothetical protein
LLEIIFDAKGKALKKKQKNSANSCHAQNSAELKLKWRWSCLKQIKPSICQQTSFLKREITNPGQM